MTDLFKYLEDVPSDLSVDFYSEHNRKTDAYFNDGKIKLYSDELLHYGDVDLRGLPKKYGKYEFWMERKNNWQKPKLLYRVKDENVELLDFENSGSSLDFWYPSDDGTLLLYGTSEGGNEQTTIRVIKTDTREVMTDTIEFAGFTDQGNICWLNAKSFIYPRMNGFGKHGPEDKWLLGTKLYLHVLGENPADDVLVFGTELPDIVMLIPTLSHDKRYLYVAICEDELTHSLVRVEINSLKFKQISIDNPGACIVKTAPGVVYILTNNNAERYRLLMCEERFFSYSLDEWDEILPESDDILQDFWIHSSKQIIALYSHKVSSRLRIFDQYGDQTGVIETPKLSVVSGVSCGADSSTIYYSLSGFTTPSSIYRLDKPDDRSNLIWQREGSRGDDDILAEQFWAVSKDGTRIPYFLVKRKDTPVDAPCIIYGYGGFNISLEPSYLTSSRPWVMGGGVYVLANLRGGSEFGEQWHKSGALELKQNTFDDCIAIAEDLLERKITSPDKLGVLGGSNGGLLVAAVTIQRPDLFRAGAALVPLTDMLEFYKHQVAEFWVHEYGDPRIPEQKEWIQRWSPYHYPVDASLTYPALYYETALNDARVHPFHALKMVARLESEIKKWKGPLLLRTLTDTGHQSSNKTKRDIALQTAEYYGFFMKELGL